MSPTDSARQNDDERRMNRRNFLRVGGMGLLGSVLAACGASSASSPAPSANTAATSAPADPAATAAPAAPATEAPSVLKGAKVQFLGGPWTFLPEMDTVIDEFALDWGRQNNVEVTFERDQQLLPKIQTSIETRSGANIIQYTSAPTIFANALVDVTDIAEEISAEGGGYLPAGPFQMRSNGRWLGVPMGQHNWFVNYRQDWFREEGYDVFPDTWEEALVAGAKMKARGVPYAMTMSDQAAGDGNAIPRILLWAFGGKEFNEDGSLALDSAETLAALEFAIRLHNEAGDPGETAYDDAGNNAAFLAGKSSMTLNVNTVYLPAKTSNPELAEGMNHALPPAGPAGRFGFGSLPWWGILNHTQGADLDAARDWMREFYKMENFSKLYKAGQGYILPLLPKYEQADIWPSDPKLAIAKEMFQIALPPGYAMKEQNKLAGLIQDKVLIGKLFSLAATTGNARSALDQVLTDIADLELLA